MDKTLGVGFMRHTPNDFNNTQQIVDSAMKSGVNYFESCYFYLNNQCEQIVQKALAKYPRDSYQLCAKMPVKGVLEQSLDPAIIFEEQLSHLQTSYFDVYLLQALDRSCIEILYKSKVIPYLLQQKKLGKIKKLGFSFHGTPEVLKNLLDLHCWDIVQLQLNYYDYFLSSGKQNYELVEQYNLPIIVMGPTKGGTLINQLPLEAKKILGTDWKFYPYKFLASLKNVSIILTGAENVVQFKENANYFQQQLQPCSKDEWLRVEQAIKIFQDKHYIQCTGCAYCQPCPVGINIPQLFRDYNMLLKLGKNTPNFNQIMEEQRDTMPIFRCVGCGRCEHHCPQHLPIRDLFSTHLFQMRL